VNNKHVIAALLSHASIVAALGHATLAEGSPLPQLLAAQTAGEFSVVLVPPAVAAGKSAPPKAAPAPQKAAPAAADPLAEAPLEADLLAFRMRVPVGTKVRVEKLPVANYLLTDGADEAAWRARASALRASRAGTTAKSQCEDYLADLRKRDQKFDELVNQPLKIAGSDAHLVYIGVPLEGGTRGIMGNLVFSPGPDDFLVFSIILRDAEFDKSRALLEQSFATLEFQDRAKAVAESNELLLKGSDLLAKITPDVLRATIDPQPRVFRMWRPDESGAKKDFGYLIIRVREGRRGEVDASKDPKKLKGEDEELGILASADARVIANDDPTHTIDVQSRYFMRWDRASESWSIRTTERQKRASRSSAQTGIRLAPTAGAPRSVLQVITASRDGMTREPLEWPLPPVYLSQAELLVLGELLPRDPTQPTIEFKDYAFDQRDQKLPQRRETWSRIENGWRLETQQGSSPAKIVQEFDARGKRVRRTDADGSVTELIALEDLRTLWKSKGLPVE